MKEEIEISTDKGRLDLALIHQFLSETSYWARGIPSETVRRSLENSLCFGAYLGTSQIGFARVVSDFATFAHLMDVFVLPPHRGKGYGKDLMEAVMSHPDLQNLRQFTLGTADAHGLYRQFGFTAARAPELFMERHDPNVYHVGSQRP